MAVKRIPISVFVAQLIAAWKRGDGYIMGSYGQNPRTGYLDLKQTHTRSSWKPTGWYYAQYSGRQRTQALKWREKCQRVWDCNGLAEGVYELETGICINSKARYNYRDWCSPKGSGMIPAKYRVPGAAVFWSDSGSGSIHHVAYLVEPVTHGKPEGDWYIIEARGVMYGVVRTKLYSRKPNYWGIMDKYFDYAASAQQNEISTAPIAAHLGGRTLRNGSEGEDVRELQSGLIRLGYDLGRWGADGDFGDATEDAVRRFQRNQGLSVDGIAGPLTIEALEKALANIEHVSADIAPELPELKVQIAGGQCYCREEANTSGAILGVAHEGVTLRYLGETSENGWHKVEWADGREGWVSGKYGRLIA